MKFGGTVTKYTVSNLSLISKVDLGPNNIRIIKPVYKEISNKKKSYYIQTKNLEKKSGKNNGLSDFVEIKLDDNNLEIPENSKIEKESLALAIDNLTRQEKEDDYKKRLNDRKNQDLNRNLENKKAKNLVQNKTTITPKKVKKENDPLLATINNLKKQESTGDSKKNSSVAKLKKIDENLAKKQEPIKTSETKIAAITTAIPESTTENVASTAVVNNSTEEEIAPKTEKADFILVNVSDVYERVAKKGYKSAYMFKEIANNCYFKDQMEKAVKWYEQLFAVSKDLEPIYYFRFGDALKKIGKTEKGNAMIEKFNQLVE